LVTFYSDTVIILPSFYLHLPMILEDISIWPRVHKETENEDQAMDQIDKFP